MAVYNIEDSLFEDRRYLKLELLLGKDLALGTVLHWLDNDNQLRHPMRLSLVRKMIQAGVLRRTSPGLSFTLSEHIQFEGGQNG